MLELLQEHLENNLLKVIFNYYTMIFFLCMNLCFKTGNKKYIHQLKGVPQGSVLSSMLCNLYLSNIL